MPLLPEEITPATLPRRLRGYHPGHVDTLLARVAADYTAAIHAVAHDEPGVPPPQHTRAHHETEPQITPQRQRAEAIAAVIIGQAEQAAQALTAHAEALGRQAHADAEAARARLAEADSQVRRLDQLAREGWDSLRAELEDQWDQIMSARQRLDERERELERALAALRSRASLLDQLAEVDNLLAGLRLDPHDNRAPGPKHL